MTVLKGEGKYPILYASTRLPIGRNLAAYIARPDLAGAHPTVIVAHPGSGISSHTKGLCRHLARHGFAVICPNLFRGSRPPPDAASGDAALGEIPARRLRSDLLDAIETADAPGTGWADPSRLGLLGVGAGAGAAVAAAPHLRALSALALAAPPPPDPDGTWVLDGLAGVRVPVLVVAGGADGAVPAERLAAVRRGAPSSQWVVYREMGPGFLDESAPDYDPAAAADGLNRLVAFLERGLAAP